MYAIIETGGKQYKVQAGDVVDLELLEVAEDNTIEFDKVLAVSGDDELKVGTPIVEGAKVTAELVDHIRGKKLVVFKMKRRKGYRKKKGHRQELTRVRIVDIQA
ncbi:50S ribosomal protein L21 [bacterium M21]|nr:50S ribosomal protein L21 [bacterium M21]